MLLWMADSEGMALRNGFESWRTILVWSGWWTSWPPERSAMMASGDEYSRGGSGGAPDARRRATWRAVGQWRAPVASDHPVRRASGPPRVTRRARGEVAGPVSDELRRFHVRPRRRTW